VPSRVLRALPRRFRAEHGLDERVAQLRDELEGDRYRILDGMASLESDSLDIAECVRSAQAAVSDLSPLEVLARLSHIDPPVPVDKVMRNAAETAAHSLSHMIFGRETRVGRSPRWQEGNGAITGPVKH
jgi:hypothetical protein